MLDKDSVQPLVNTEEDFDETFDERPAQPEQAQPEVTAPSPEEPKLEVNGLTLDDLSLDESEETAPTLEEPSVEEKPLGYEEFANSFQKYLGVSLDGVKTMLAELQSFRVETLVEKQQNQLKGKWGDAYDERFSQVTDYFAKLPPEKQKALDNVEGAELIWAKLQQDQQQQQRSQTPNVPNYVSGRTVSTQQRTSTGNKNVLQHSDIIKMSPEEYRARQYEIQAAFDEGRVNMDDSGDWI